MRTGRFAGTLCVTAVIFLTCSRVSWGQNEINIVSPSELDGVEGRSSEIGGPAARAQFLYPAADFMSLPESYRTIVGFAWRPDQSNTLTNPVSGPARFLLSTTAADRLSTVFANNVGDDETLVFDGIVTWQTDTTGAGPRDFDFFVSFDEPFTYDPRRGRNLLLEFVPTANWDNVGNWRVDSQGSTTGNITFVAAGGPLANTASVALRGGLWPAQFTFISELGTLGDFNSDGVLDTADLEELIAEILTGGIRSPFDVNGDGSVDREDLTTWVADLKQTYLGDANLDGEFNSSDMVQVFQRGKYETGDDASWADGDWNADLVFNSSDMVAAFADGGYEKGPKPLAVAVPEPASALLLLSSLVVIAIRRRCFDP